MNFFPTALAEEAAAGAAQAPQPAAAPSEGSAVDIRV